jgi:hypothetical protein
VTGYQQWGSNLTRYEGLKPGEGLGRGAALTGGGQLARRGRIRPVSDKRRAKNRERRAMVERLYGDERPRCSVPWCPNLADDLHEPHSRAQGGDIADEENQVPLCRTCHDLITFRPRSELQWAFDLGLRVDGWAGRGDAA